MSMENTRILYEDCGHRKRRRLNTNALYVDAGDIAGEQHESDSNSYGLESGCDSINTEEQPSSTKQMSLFNTPTTANAQLRSATLEAISAGLVDEKIESCKFLSDRSHETEGLGHQVRASQICFGMIGPFPVVLSNPCVLNYERDTKNATFSQPNLLLSKSDLALLGTVNEYCGKVLRLLNEDEDIELQLSFLVTQQYAKLGRRSQSKKTMDIACLSVIIYGSLELFDDIGDFLQEKNIYLQDPKFCDRNVEYRNPHRLSRLDSHVPMTLEITAETISRTIQIAPEPADILLDFESGAELAETESPRFLRTPLQRHQKQALTFMARREEGWDLRGPECDIWKEESYPSGIVQYINQVSGSRQSQCPAKFRGGILADHMGLGKTLSMIALIALEKEILNTRLETTEKFVGPTLLVVPSSLLKEWEDQLTRHLLPNTLKWGRHYRKQRITNTLEFMSCDVVITTYQTITSEQRRLREDAPSVCSRHWNRIVLDEGHNIRDSTRSTAKAICKISANSRWVITGTPIQNRLSDLASLLNFLQVYPYADPQIFDTDITQLWKSGSDDKAIQRLKRLLTCIMLRRSKATVELPERRDVLEYLDFNPDERAAYDSARFQTIEAINATLASGSSLAVAYRNALAKINALRMICNVGVSFQCSKLSVTPSFQEHDMMTWDSISAQEAFNNLVTVGSTSCAKCSIEIEQTEGEKHSEDLYQPQLTRCLRLMCGGCYQTLTELDYRNSPCEHTPPCPVRAVSTMSSQSALTSQRILLSGKYPVMSTKMRALVADLSTTAYDEKSLVFSFWTSTLDMVEVALGHAGVSFARFDGQISAQKRNQALQNFQSDPSVKVLLLTISCGAVGLNLCAASRAYLMEPHWNPSVEAQALARIYRIGQTKPVTTVRFVMRNSFEEHVIKVQNRKKCLADLLLSQKNISELELAQSRILQLQSLLG